MVCWVKYLVPVIEGFSSCPESGPHLKQIGNVICIFHVITSPASALIEAYSKKASHSLIGFLCIKHLRPNWQVIESIGILLRTGCHKSKFTMELPI